MQVALACPSRIGRWQVVHRGFGLHVKQACGICCVCSVLLRPLHLVW